jgi:hypothetical protein
LHECVAIATISLETTSDEGTMQLRSTHSYRCYYHPRTDTVADAGVLPSIRLRATDAEHAMRVAHAVLGHPIDSVERVEPTLAGCS